MDTSLSSRRVCVADSDDLFETVLELIKFSAEDSIPYAYSNTGILASLGTCSSLSLCVNVCTT